MIGIATDGYWSLGIGGGGGGPPISLGGQSGGVPVTQIGGPLKPAVSASELRPTMLTRKAQTEPQKPSAEPLRPSTSAQVLKPVTDADPEE